MSEISQARINDAAMIAHEANRAYCLTIGDSSHLDWRSSPENIRASVVSGAAAIAADPSITPEESHEKWSAYKIAEGWVYGEKKDLEAKTHPCLVPYDELPENDRRKDAIFGAVVRAVLGFHQPADIAADYALAIDDHNAIVETLSNENAALRAEVDELRIRVQPHTSRAPVPAPTIGDPTESEGAQS